MSEKSIHIGYETETGEPVSIKPSHLIVTGITQLSGKTTTLEALITRSGLKAIVFKTKIGEKSFTKGTETPPFFRDRSDYEFVKSLIEAYNREKLFLEKGTLMRLCKGAASLVEIKQRVDEKLAEGKLRGLKEEIHTRLQHYLESLIPQIQYANLSNTLNISEGINIMNLERFKEEAQSLIIQSVADEVLKTMKGTILVIPEAWKFLPQKYSNPCKRVVEAYIRQGATNQNYVWIDSQDMAGVDKLPLKQISTWILGYQAERNEVKHTLDQISLPKKMKPKEDDIMTLRKGHFYLSSYDGVKKIYVQPTWLPNETAIQIAKGEKNVDELEAPSSLTPYSVQPQDTNNETGIQFDDSKIRNQLIELRTDFFNKIEEQQTAIQKAFSEIYAIQSNQTQVDTNEIVSLVLQKMPASNGVNKEEIIAEVLQRVPKVTGSITYEVKPLEKLRKDFMEEAKTKILGNIQGLDDQQKKVLKWIEQHNKQTTKKEVFENCFGKAATGGSTYTALVKKVTVLKQLELVKIDTANRIYPFMHKRISDLMEQYGASSEDIQQVYDHILMELL